MREYSSLTWLAPSWVQIARQMCVAVALLTSLPVWAQDAQAPVTAQHLAAINQAFSRNGILTGRVESDAYGRVTSRGSTLTRLRLTGPFHWRKWWLALGGCHL